jgi:hypothetical protein
MATVTLQPSGNISSGSFDNNLSTGAFGYGFINDLSNSTYVYNTSANQNFVVHLDNTSGLTGATFNNFQVTAVFQKHGARGTDASFEVEIGDASSATTFGSISDTTFITTNATPTTINATAINFGGSVSSSDVDDMRISVTGTDGTQIRLFQLYVRIDYTAASGYGNAVNGVAAANIGKINGVATAGISKVNGI